MQALQLDAIATPMTVSSEGIICHYTLAKNKRKFKLLDGR